MHSNQRILSYIIPAFPHRYVRSKSPLNSIISLGVLPLEYRSGTSEKRRQKTISGPDCLNPVSFRPAGFCRASQRTRRGVTAGRPFFWSLFFWRKRKVTHPAGRNRGYPTEWQLRLAADKLSGSARKERAFIPDPSGIRGNELMAVFPNR
jgi:hypothetical protein